MEITYYGDSSFYIKGKKTSIACNPIKNTPQAKVSVCSSGKCETENGYGIDWPGEYEVAEISIEGIDVNEGEKNTILYSLHIEEVNIVILANLDHMPTEDQIAKIANSDILIVPVGGKTVLDSKTAAKLVENCDPKVVIPMQYDFTGAEPLNNFLKELGRTGLETRQSYEFEKSSLPVETMDIVVLETK